MRYEYPFAKDSKSAWLQFMKDYGRRPNHCFQNTWGKGYIIFDTKEDVNVWHEEHTGEYFYKEEPKPGQVFTKEDAFNEIIETYGSTIDSALSSRDCSLPLLMIGLPSSTAFGNQMALFFVLSDDDEHISWRFYYHYTAKGLKVSGLSNDEIKTKLLNILYQYFYESRFKKRMENKL